MDLTTEDLTATDKKANGGVENVEKGGDKGGSDADNKTSEGEKDGKDNIAYIDNERL